MGTQQVRNYDDYDRIRYFYYVWPTKPSPAPWDWWPDPMSTTTQSVTTFSSAEKRTLLLYDIFIPMLGAAIIILNLLVVISSALLLRKGQQPYTTYMFLGNVAVSDLLTGFAVIYGQYAPRELRGEDNCAIMIGLIVSMSLVSVYSVGLIAIDRFLYILYGLQYQRYLTRTRARILIATTWLIGLVIGFLPALGWRGDTEDGRTCWFIRLAPPPLVILTAVVGILPVLLVIVLYSIILQKALRRVTQLKKASRELRGVQTGNLRLFRGGGAPSGVHTRPQLGAPSDTDTGALSEDEHARSDGDSRRCVCLRSRCCSSRRASRMGGPGKQLNGSGTGPNATVPNATTTNATGGGGKGPTKWKAIKVVMFTTGSFVVTWVPYFIASLMYVACDPATNEERCRGLQFAIASPLAVLGFANSLLNPIIYAWWHNGFRASMKRLAENVRRRLSCCRCCCADGSRCCHKSSHHPSPPTTSNPVGPPSLPGMGGDVVRPQPNRASAGVGNRHSDQEFSITDDTDIEQPGPGPGPGLTGAATRL